MQKSVAGRKPNRCDFDMNKKIGIIAFCGMWTYLLIKFQEKFSVSISSFLHETAVKKTFQADRHKYKKMTDLL